MSVYINIFISSTGMVVRYLIERHNFLLGVSYFFHEEYIYIYSCTFHSNSPHYSHSAERLMINNDKKKNEKDQQARHLNNEKVTKRFRTLNHIVPEYLIKRLQQVITWIMVYGTRVITLMAWLDNKTKPVSIDTRGYPASNPLLTQRKTP